MENDEKGEYTKEDSKKRKKTESEEKKMRKGVREDNNVKAKRSELVEGKWTIGIN